MNITKAFIAQEFLRLVATGQVKLAFERYVSEDFIHHNPFFAGDRASLRQAMEDDAKANPKKLFQILRTIEDDKLVAVHSTVQQDPDAEVFVLVHIFRFEEDKIVEAWDVGQIVPADIPNKHGMF